MPEHGDISSIERREHRLTGVGNPGRFSLPVVPGESRRASGVPPRAPDEVRARRRLVDSHGRTIQDLRLSITDRCNFRCVYCMEPDVRFAPEAALLTTPEIIRVARVAESLGVRKVRITGGEPTVHPDLDAIIAGIRGATGVELAMITNGSAMDRAAAHRWKNAGLDRVSISIDSVRPDRFARVTRSRTTPADVLAAVEHAIDAGLTPVKLNAVLVRGFNEDEAVDLAGLARTHGVEVRFIEYMPLDSGHAWDRSRVVTAAETQRAIEARFPLVATGDGAESSTAVTYRFADGVPGRIGFIAPVSSPFCGACSRLRITADGMVRPCLFSTTEWDLRPVVRAGGSDAEIADFLIDATWTKQASHGLSTSQFRQPDRPMSAIGG